MSEQPEALRLADELEDAYPNVHTGLAPSSAAELRRLHALCEEMGEALEMGVQIGYEVSRGYLAKFYIKAIPAIAKWKESK